MSEAEDKHDGNAGRSTFKGWGAVTNTARRILVAGEFWFGSTANGLAHGLRGLGWDVVPIEMREHFTCSPLLAMRIAARALRPLGMRSYNDAIIQTARDIEPHAFLVVKGAYISIQTLRSLERMGVITADYYTDFHFQHAGIDHRTLSLYDFVFSTKSFQIAPLIHEYGARAARFLHHGYSSGVHRPRLAKVEESDYIADCLFVGGYTRYKADWLLKFRQTLPSVDLKIFGDAWRPAVRNTLLEPCYVGHSLWGDAYSRALQTSRINIAIHAGPAGPQGWQDKVSTRTFEIPACRGFMLHIDNDEVRSLYTPGEEIDVFRTPGELAERAMYYLQRPESRRAMIDRAFTRCVPAYAYDARARDIAATLEKRLCRCVSADAVAY